MLRKAKFWTRHMPEGLIFSDMNSGKLFTCLELSASWTTPVA
jgi:hypothetical protein